MQSKKIQRNTYIKFGILTKDGQTRPQVPIWRTGKKIETVPAEFFLQRKIKTIDEYLKKNPDGVQSTDLYHFYEMSNDGTETLIGFGRFSRPMPTVALADDTNEATKTPQPFQLHQSHYADTNAMMRQQLDAHERQSALVIETMQKQIDALASMLNSKEIQISDLLKSFNEREQQLQQRIAGLEQKTLEYNVELQIERSAHSATKEAFQNQEERKVEIERIKSKIRKEAEDEAAKIASQEIKKAQALNDGFGMNSIGELVSAAGSIMDLVQRMKSPEPAQPNAPAVSATTDGASTATNTTISEAELQSQLIQI
jgi:hypothetical protein